MTNTPPKPEHLDVFIEDDLVVVRARGAIDEPVARHIAAIHDEVALHVGYALNLQDCRQTTALTQEARHFFFQWNRRRQYPGAVAVVGASFATKTMAMLLGRAVKLLATVQGEIDFFDTDAEARAWLDKQRDIIKDALLRQKMPRG